MKQCNTIEMKNCKVNKFNITSSSLFIRYITLSIEAVKMTIHYPFQCRSLFNPASLSALKTYQRFPSVFLTIPFR